VSSGAIVTARLERVWGYEIVAKTVRARSLPCVKATVQWLAR
jgi:hypothetical protein